MDIDIPTPRELARTITYELALVYITAMRAQWRKGWRVHHALLLGADTGPWLDRHREATARTMAAELDYWAALEVLVVQYPAAHWPARRRA